MSPDPITYCLERVSDYREFERLCSAFLAEAGYPEIEPLGGTGDGGRDAVVRGATARPTTVFAYTVRADWLTKLRSDCARIKQMGHAPSTLVFVCTQALSATENDGAYRMVATDFGWRLDLFDIERLRANLVGKQRHLIAQHPSIFTPPFFPQRGGVSLTGAHDILVIDHVDSDHAVATWLARRLSLAGHQTWCRGTAPLVGEDPDETIRQLQETRAAQYLPILSTSSLANRGFVERCALAAARSGFVIPCSVLQQVDDRIPSRLEKIAPADFGNTWDGGLRSVMAKLASLGVTPALDATRGSQIALRDFLPTRVTVASPERVFANDFSLRLPRSMLVYDLRFPLTEAEERRLRPKWAFATVNAYQLVAFDLLAEDVAAEIIATRETDFAWRETAQRGEKRTVDLAKQLAWRSLDVACASKHLEYCDSRKVYFFPPSDAGGWVQPIRHVDGRKTTVNLTGMRTKGYGENASPFFYQLAPRFSVRADVGDAWTMSLSVYVRTTTLAGVPFEGKEIGRRRKIVGKSWWNQQWLARLLGVVQALETALGEIRIGEGHRAVVMSTAPLEWQCPVGIDVLALSGLSDIGPEIADFRSEADCDEGADGAEPLAPETEDSADG